MAEPLIFTPGGYRCLAVPGGPFSGGVAAEPGFALHRARFVKPLPMAEGFRAAEAHLARLGRPMTAVAGCELRSPAPMSRADFNAFNAEYLKTLHGWGLRHGEINVAARSNIAPVLEIPAATTLFAVTYSMPLGGPAAGAAGDFLISGKPELDGSPQAGRRIIAEGDASPAGMLAKTRFVVEFLRAQVAALGCDWAGVTGTQLYTPHEIQGLGPVLAEAGLTVQGLAWFPAWPPVAGLDFEADVRRISAEFVL